MAQTGIIALKGMEFFAYHGFYDEEQKIGNRYGVDLAVKAHLEGAAQDDDLSGTINYEALYAIVRKEMEKPSKLLEYLAQSIIDQVMVTFSQVLEVEVTVRKFNPPIGGICESANVTLQQSRN